MNVKKRYPSWQIFMNQIQRKRIYYLSLNIFVSYSSRCNKICHFRRSYNLWCLTFLSNSWNERDVFKPGQPYIGLYNYRIGPIGKYRPIILPASAERSFSRLKQIKSYTRSTMDEIRLSDLSILNIEEEFSENLDFNSVCFSWHFC